MSAAKLFPRRPGQAKDSNTVARAMAHRYMDAARDGDKRVTQTNIEWALRQTGDIDPMPYDRNGALMPMGR